MTKRKEIGNKPAGKSDVLDLTYTQFAADEKKREIRILHILVQSQTSWLLPRKKIS